MSSSADLDDAFLTAAQAVDESGPLSPAKQRLDTRLRLTLWGLYQQATQGDAPEDGEDALGGLGFGKKVLWREWQGRKGMSVRDAKEVDRTVGIPREGCPVVGRMMAASESLKHEEKELEQNTRPLRDSSGGDIQ